MFPYSCKKSGQMDVYVMDAMPSVASGTREARASDQAAVVIVGPDRDAIIGRNALRRFLPNVRWHCRSCAA